MRVAYLGDGNNVRHSLMRIAARTGMHYVAACPRATSPTRDRRLLHRGRAASGGSVEVVTDATDGVRGAQVLYTDVWTSMGQEEEHVDGLGPRCVPPRRASSLAGPDAIAMHCLPAHVGEEITADVLYGDRSLVWDQAENRLHVYKAVLALTVR